MELAFRGLEKVHPPRRRLFRGWSAEFPQGQFACLVGPSGCGKSSLLRLAAGLDVPTSGEIRRTAREVGFVFQEPRLLPWLRVHENLGLPLSLRRRPADPDGIRRVLRMVRLEEECLELFPHQLSGGMKMRVSLARALILQPGLFLMDEPLAALDESTRQLLQEEIARIHEARPATTLLVTHSLSEALFLGDRILILGRDGELLADEQPGFARPRTEALRTDPEFIRRLQVLSHQFRRLLASPEAPC